LTTHTRSIVAYYRLERREARQARGALAERERTVVAWLRTRKAVLLEPFVEVAIASAARPELERALERCRTGRARLLVPRLAEVGADLPFLEALLASRVTLIAVDTPRLSRTTLAVLRDVARHTSSAAGGRVREGLAGARRRGTRLGSPRPEIGARRAGALLRERADARAASIGPWIEEIELGNPGCSLREVARVLAELGVPTPRGGRWGPSGVRNIVRRQIGRRAPPEATVRRSPAP
jgi:DNA invertase Pin-like site-specific DNA recombinase